jgi:hypothetical protein
MWRVVLLAVKNKIRKMNVGELKSDRQRNLPSVSNLHISLPLPSTDTKGFQRSDMIGGWFGVGEKQKFL